MIGFLDQELRSLQATQTVVEEVHALQPLSTEGEMRSYLARFLFSGDEVFRTVERLSGGERCRLALAKLFMQGPNLVLLDEPTNHLDVDGREALEQALEDYEGTVVAVSHDRAFLANFARKSWFLHDGRLDVVTGGYAEFLEARAALTAPASAGSEGENLGARMQDERKRERRAREREARERARRAARLETLEEDIARVDRSLAAVVEHLSRADLSAADRRRATSEHAELDEQRRVLYEAWEQLVEEGED
jgi:ATP-binding cassette subfamily F protein 3